MTSRSCCRDPHRGVCRVATAAFECTSCTDATGRTWVSFWIVSLLFPLHSSQRSHRSLCPVANGPPCSGLSSQTSVTGDADAAAADHPRPSCV